MLTPTSKNSCKAKSKDVIQTENNIRQEQIPAKPVMYKFNKRPLEKNPSRLIQSIETKSRKIKLKTLKTEESPTENKNTRTDSTNTEMTAKQNAINKATQNLQNSNDKTKSETPDKKKFPVTVIFGDYMANDIKG